ncbi:cytochrome P450 [Scytonema tolypothrichoides VB-61278]|nr:cytochrome P450 [Scytonema tolypothrichoides VB-61278]
MAVNEQVDLFSPAFKANPYPTYAHLRKNAPVYRAMQSNGQPVWVITRYDDVIAVMKDPRFVKDYRKVMSPEQFADQPIDESILKIWNVLDRNMLSSDPPAHSRLRGLVSKGFTARRIEELRPRIQKIADELLDAVQDKGLMDLLTEYAFPLSITVISEMLGIPSTDHDKFRHWSNAIVEKADIMQPDLDAEALVVAAEFFEYLRTLLNKRRMNPTSDLISALITAEEQGDKLDENELISMVYLLIIAGHETTVNLIGNGTLALLQHPDQLTLLKKDPSLIKSAVEEFLRYNGSVETATIRYACEDVEIGGQVISKGDVVLVILVAANHDPKQFDDPEVLKITRKVNQHIAFGHGIHYCLGAPLARLEGEIAINTLLRRLPNLQLAVAPEELCWRPGMHIRGLQALPVKF